MSNIPDWATHYFMAFDKPCYVKMDKDGDCTYMNYGFECSLHKCYHARLVEISNQNPKLLERMK